MCSKIFDLSGKVSVVSGAAQGMGKAMAVALAEAGSDMAIVDLNGEGLSETASYIESIGRSVETFTVDVSDVDAIPGIFVRVMENCGRIDFLGNVAGGETVMGSSEDFKVEDFEKSIKSLVVGRFLMCREAGKIMLNQGSGSIVNIGSIGGISSLGRGQIAYQTAMGAVVQMTRSLATEWASRGVRVNAILPAQVLNPGLQRRIEETPEVLNTFLSGIPAGRLGDPDDIKGLSVLLASDAASWITGALIPMDGGNTALNAGGSYPGSPQVSG